MGELITSYDGMKVADYLRLERPSKVALVFWHGLGDLVMFLTTFHALRKQFREIKIDLALQEGVGQGVLVPDAVLISNPNKALGGYDYTFQVHYPMAEGMRGEWTKNEWCCVSELGISPINTYPAFRQLKVPKPVGGKYLVGLHFQATALPNACNPSEEVAERIWNEVKGTGFMPVETFFKHRYYNPVNEKFPFIPDSRTVRHLAPTVSSLIALLQLCYANICVASGNLPLSLAIAPERLLYLKKDFDISSYTKHPVPSVDVENYHEGAVKQWLESLKKEEQHE